MEMSNPTQLETPEEMARELLASDFDERYLEYYPRHSIESAAAKLAAWRDKALERARKEAYTDGRLFEANLYTDGQPPAPESGDVNTCGARDMDDIYGFVETALTAKSGLSLDYEEVVMLQSALLARTSSAEIVRSKLYAEIVSGSQLCLDEPKWRLPQEVCDLICKTVMPMPEPPKEGTK